MTGISAGARSAKASVGDVEGADGPVLAVSAVNLLRARYPANRIAATRYD